MIFKTAKTYTHPTCQKRIEPSDPPLANRPSWWGCHAMHDASFLWPLNTCKKWMIKAGKKVNVVQRYDIQMLTKPHIYIYHMNAHSLTWNSVERLRISKSLSRWSLEAEQSQLPLAFHFRSMTVLLWACLKKWSKIIPNEFLQHQRKE